MFSLFGKKDKAERAEPSLLERLKASVTKTKAALAETVDTIFLGERKIDPSVLKDLETALISADIGVKTTREVLDSVKEKMDRNALSNTMQLKQEIKSHIARILQPTTELQLTGAANNGTGPRVVFIVGVNGVGKTTSIGKLANRLRQQGLNV
ncbi:MAG: signal recognition particle receptor subunit alpha, partial [Acidobacteria bacterium]|nr:signal recognition particle receptor subunit alpha [Acidobacteriota bacterium]